GSYLRRARILALADELQGLELALSLEEPPPRRQLEQHDAAREDIAARVEGLAPRLLGGHVRDLPLELAALGLHLHLRVALGDPEVDDLDVTRERHDH